jgi:hypothetical protein
LTNGLQKERNGTSYPLSGLGEAALAPSSLARVRLLSLLGEGLLPRLTERSLLRLSLDLERLGDLKSFCYQLPKFRATAFAPKQMSHHRRKCRHEGFDTWSEKGNGCPCACPSSETCP